MNRRKIGADNEARALEYLEGAGYRILARNFRNRTGEIDIIALDGEYLVFIEVKYRANDACGSPLEAVDGRKQRSIIRTALCYMHRYGYGTEASCRFDVVGIAGDQITLIQNAFGT